MFWLCVDGATIPLVVTILIIAPSAPPAHNHQPCISSTVQVQSSWWKDTRDTLMLKALNFDETRTKRRNIKNYVKTNIYSVYCKYISSSSSFQVQSWCWQDSRDTLIVLFFLPVRYQILFLEIPKPYFYSHLTVTKEKTPIKVRTKSILRYSYWN